MGRIEAVASSVRKILTRNVATRQTAMTGTQGMELPYPNGRNVVMNKIWPRIAALVLLAGCNAQPVLPFGETPATQLQIAKLVKNINQLTDQDLKNAIALANGMTPKDAQAINCFSYIQKILPMLRSEANMLTANSGAFTSFEADHILVGFVQNGLPQKADLEANCGPYFLNAVGGLNFLLEQIKVNPVPLPKL